MKNALRILAVLTLMALLISGCAATVEDKEFSCQELTMTVPGYMTDKSDDADFANFTFALDSYKIAIFGIREDHSLFEGTDINNLDIYTETLIQVSNLDCAFETREGKDYLYFTYTAENAGTTYAYVCGTFMTDEAFWMVQVASEEDKFDEAEFLAILDTVMFP